MKIYGDHLGNAYHPKKFRSKTHSMISYGLIWSLIQRLRGFVQWIVGCGYLSGQIWNMRLATFCFSDAIHLCDLSDRTASLWFNNYKLARNEYVKFKIKNDTTFISALLTNNHKIRRHRCSFVSKRISGRSLQFCIIKINKRTYVIFESCVLLTENWVFADNMLFIFSIQ